MKDEIKTEWNTALFHFERVLQGIGITEEQQEELTKGLASFGEGIDYLLRWIEILDRYCSRLGSSDDQIENWIGKLESLLKRIDELGKTDAHTGDQTIEERFNIIEGMQDIFCSAHKGHTNYSEIEFIGMHGEIGDKRLDGIQNKLDKITKRLDGIQNKLDKITKRLDGIQNKLDKITKLLENAKFEITFKDAMKL